MRVMAGEVLVNERINPMIDREAGAPRDFTKLRKSLSLGGRV